MRTQDRQPDRIKKVVLTAAIILVLSMNNSYASWLNPNPYSHPTPTNTEPSGIHEICQSAHGFLEACRELFVDVPNRIPTRLGGPGTVPNYGNERN